MRFVQLAHFEFHRIGILKYTLFYFYYVLLLLRISCYGIDLGFNSKL